MLKKWKAKGCRTAPLQCSYLHKLVKTPKRIAYLIKLHCNTGKPILLSATAFSGSEKWKPNQSIVFLFVFCSFADTKQLERQVLRATFFGFNFQFYQQSDAGNRTRDGWVRSTNASSVLCRPTIKAFCQLSIGFGFEAAKYFEALER